MQLYSIQDFINSDTSFETSWRRMGLMWTVRARVRVQNKAKHFVSPEACFRASVLEDCRDETEGAFEKYKQIVYSSWREHVSVTVRRWLHSSPYDISFERWCRDHVYYNQWMCLISGGPLGGGLPV